MFQNGFDIDNFFETEKITYQYYGSLEEIELYVETDNLQNFVCYNSPHCVIVAIEFFEIYNRDTDFDTQVNAILKLNDLDLKLDNGKIVNTFDGQIKCSTLTPIQEAGLKELLQETTKFANV